MSSSEKTPEPEPERELEHMEEESERLGQHIERARDDWEQKERDSSIPGAQPEEGTATGNPDAAGSDEPDKED